MASKFSESPRGGARFIERENGPPRKVARISMAISSDASVHSLRTRTQDAL